MKNAERVPMRLCLGFGIGMLGMGVVTTVPSLMLLFYLTNTLGLPAGLAGMAVFVPKAVILFSDPTIGLLSDRLRSPWGRRRPFMLAGALLTGAAFGLLFSTPVAGPAVTVVAAALAYLACSVASSLFGVPYAAMPGEMTEDPHERTRIMAFRMAFGMTGVVLAGALAPALVEWLGGGRRGYGAMGWIVGGICAAAMLASTFGTARARFRASAPSGPGLGRQIQLIGRNRPFLLLAGAFALQIVAIGGVTALIPYYVRYRLGEGAATVSLLFVVVSVFGVAAMAPWTWLSRRIGKVVGYRLAVCAYVLALGLFGAVSARLQAEAPVVLAAMAALSGVALAGINLFCVSLLPDVIQLDERATGLSRGAIYTGVWSALEKTGAAAGALLGGFVLSSHGFVSSTDPTQVQSAGVVQGVLVGFVYCPATFMVASLVPLLNPGLRKAIDVMATPEAVSLARAAE